MTERPILMSAPMVRAILAGTKTQTRRVVKLPDGVAPAEVTLTRMQDGYHDGTRPVWEHCGDPNAFSSRCPYGKPGDRLWVRETWAYGTHALAAERDEDGPFVYAATNFGTQGRLCERWRPSIHMPRSASRITLEVKGVRVERLQDISEADAISEGLMPLSSGADRTWTVDGNAASEHEAARDTYMWLWEQINGVGSAAATPWVWVVEFKRVEAR